MNFLRTPVTWIMILVCVLIFITIQRQRESVLDTGIVRKYGLIPIQVKRGQYYRLFTGGLIHLQIYHLLVNMYALYNLGSLMEVQLGSLWFTVILVLSIVGGNLACVYYGDSRTITVGISGGLYGLLAAYIIMLLRYGILTNPAVLSSVLRVVIINAIIMMMPNVSVLGHLGGAAAGAILAVIRFFIF